MALLEIVVAVDDLDDGLKAYCDGLGMKLLARDTLGANTACSLWGGEAEIQVAVVGRPDVADSPRLRLVAASPATARGTTSASSPVGGSAKRPDGDTRARGSLGIGFTTREIESARRQVAAAGVRFLSDPVKLTPDSEGPTGPQRFEAFGQAPNGEFAVLIDRRNVPTAYGTLSSERPISEPLHTSWVVSDQTHCGRFMARVLGHELMFREECEGEEFERLMGIEKGTHFWFSMLGHPDHPTGRIIFIQFEHARDAPPRSFTRGITGLAYSCVDLDATLARGAAVGVSPPSDPIEVDDPILGQGRVAVLQPPWGGRLELWERA